MFAAGVNVILTTKAIDDMALKYFVEAGAIGIRRVPLSDLRRLARATGGGVLPLSVTWRVRKRSIRGNW